MEPIDKLYRTIEQGGFVKISHYPEPTKYCAIKAVQAKFPDLELTEDEIWNLIQAELINNG